MANRDKRSRALLRNLRKQARKGTLSAREQDTLLNQEKKFRKARRRRRRGIGAGLGAALGAGVGAYLASPAFASLLQSGADALAVKKALKAKGASEEEAAKVQQAVEGAPEGASPEEIVQEVESQVAPSNAADDLALELADRAEILDRKGIGVAGDEELIRDIESIEEDEESIDDEFARPSIMNPSIFDDPLSMRSDAETEEVTGRPSFLPSLNFEDPENMDGAMQERRNLMRDKLAEFDETDVDGKYDPLPLTAIGPGVVDQDNPYMEQGGLRDIDPRTEQRLAAARESMRLRDNQISSDNMRERVETLERLRREGGFDPFTGEYVDSDRQQRIDAEFDEDFMREAFTDEERAAESENARLDALDRARAQGSGIPLRTGGPRVQARGGKNPKMADLMKKVKAKYGIR